LDHAIDLNARATHRGPRTSPDQETTGWPPGVPYIVGNEGCERFSYYGMKSILYVYMADSLYKHYEPFQDRAADIATAHFHLFGAGVYVIPMVGAVIADRFLGKYRTILQLSLVYCAGHAVLSLTEGSLWGLWIGLTLVAIGSGGIKPCVSAHVGDQFGKNNWFRLEKVYQIFYFMINFGSTFSTLLIPWVFDLRKTRTDFWGQHAVSVAFAIPGTLMFIATIVFFMGRNVFVHVPPSPGGRLGLLDATVSFLLFMMLGHLFFSTGLLPGWGLVLVSLAFAAAGLGLFAVRQRIEQDEGFLAVMLFSAHAWLTGKGRAPTDAAQRAALAPDDDLVKSRFLAPAIRRFGADVVRGPHAVLKIMGIFVMVTIFWSLFDQNGSSWVRQAEMMRTVEVLGFQVLPAQLQALNPILVMLLIPFMNYAAYPALEKLGVRMTSLRRMTAGMLLAGFSFVAVALIQIAIDGAGPGRVNILWQSVPYLIITVAEVLVSITGLEFAYSQAPKKMKSTIMGFWLFTMGIGNLLVSLMAEFSKLPLATFFWVFAGLMVLAGAIFGLRAHFYVERDFIQD
jgi:POT family proton-dependent oligopeptide transporter